MTESKEDLENIGVTIQKEIVQHIRDIKKLLSQIISDDAYLLRTREKLIRYRVEMRELEVNIRAIKIINYDNEQNYKLWKKRNHFKYKK